jgi:DNA-binding transcriptional ArsR family regulator
MNTREETLDHQTIPPATIEPVYYLETLEQLKVLSDPLRYRMTLLMERPATCAGLARALGLSRAKAHYHLKLLESHGLVRPHAEAIKDGIVEKYFVVRGRMLDFSRLMPQDEDAIPGNVAPETVGAIGGFLAAMLQVSGDETRRLESSHALKNSHYFDFEATVSRAEFDRLRAELAELRARVIDRSAASPLDPKDTVRFHITNYLTPLELPE